MTTEEYLGQLQGIEERILRKFEDAEVCRQRAMKMRAMRIKEVMVESSPNLHESEDAIIQAIEDEKECRFLTVQLGKKKKHILEQLENMDNRLHTTILREYYLNDKPFNEIAIDLHRSGKNVRTIYKKAIVKFEEKYGGEYLDKRTM